MNVAKCHGRGPDEYSVSVGDGLLREGGCATVSSNTVLGITPYRGLASVWFG